MIRSLHRQLATLLVLAIALALLGASGAALLVSERQLSLREQAAFLGRLDVLAHDVRMERSISSAQLAKTETSERLILTIYDNGQPISFRGGWQPITPRDELISQAIDAAARRGVEMEGGISDERFWGEVRGDHGERYLAAVEMLSGYRTQRAVVMLKDMRSEDAQRMAQRWLFAGITLCAMLMMSVFGWLFTGRAVRPIEAAHDQQNAFIAAASHELRTPLQIMQSSLDALKGKPSDPLRFVGAMQNELNRMTRLSEDLMVLTQPKGEMAARFGPVELFDLADEAAQDHLVSAAEKQISLQLVEPAAPLPLALGDALMLRRAINVLIDNAICYTQRGGHVEVSIRAERHDLLLCVQDDGPGIGAEHQSRIFERFYRADQSRSDRTHSGLGLCIAKEILEQHGGKLSFENIEPHGSRFVLRLPFMPVKNVW